MARAATYSVRKVRAALVARSESRVGAILATAMFGGPVAREYTVDSKGRKIRKFTQENRAKREDVRELLVNVRAVEEEEALEIIGQNLLRYFVQVDYLRRPKGSPFYYVTKACAEAYDLPAYMGPRTFAA